MKLLLTSTGLHGKISDFLVSEFTELENKKMCFIFTVRQEDDWKWIDMYDEEFRTLKLNYDKINISEERNFSNLDNYDIYYVAGGNTYYILDRLRKTGLDKILINEIQNDKLYIGVSAGSIVVGPDINIAGLGVDGDINDIDLDNLKGFNIVPFCVFPHYLDRNESEVEEFRLNNKNLEIITLTDEQAVFVTNEKVIFIS